MRRKRIRALVVGALLLLLLLVLLRREEREHGPRAPAADGTPAPDLLPLTLPPTPATGSEPAGSGRARPGAVHGTKAATSGTRGTTDLLPEEEQSEPPPVWLRGVLTGPDGQPLAGVTIRLEREFDVVVTTGRDAHTGEVRRVLEVRAGQRTHLVYRGGRVMAEGVAVGKTDANGRFEIPAPAAAGDYRVSFHDAAGGDASEILLRTGVYRFTPGDEGELGTLRRPRGGTIHGEVVDETGGAVAGALVSYWPDRYGRAGRELLPPGEAPVGSWMVQGGVGMTVHRYGLGRVRTDGEGRFVLRDVIPGPCSVRVLVPGAPREAVREGIDVHEAEEIYDVRVIAERARPPLLAGRVVDEATGEPVRARIRLRWSTSTSPFHSCRPDGSFLIGELAPGDYRLVVGATGYREVESGPYRLGAADRVTGIEIRMTPRDD